MEASEFLIAECFVEDLDDIFLFQEEEIKLTQQVESGYFIRLNKLELRRLKKQDYIVCLVQNNLFNFIQKAYLHIYDKIRQFQQTSGFSQKILIDLYQEWTNLREFYYQSINTYKVLKRFNLNIWFKNYDEEMDKWVQCFLKLQKISL